MFQKIRTWILKKLKPPQAHWRGGPLKTKKICLKNIKGKWAIVTILLQGTTESHLKVFSRNVNKKAKSGVVRFLFFINSNT